MGGSRFLDRFEGRADDYSKYRPRYPRKIISCLEESIGLDRSWVVADIGSGTGILSEIFLENGNRVFCVEPNADMRRVAEQNLVRYLPRFVSVDGSAEATGLKQGSIDLIVAGQALHWFDPPRARTEFTRILRKGGLVAIVYNYRKKGGAMQDAYEELVAGHSRRNAPDTNDVDDAYIGKFLGRGQVKKFVMPNSQTLDVEGLLGRLVSSSYMPPRGSPLWKGIKKDVRKVMREHGSRGAVQLKYETTLYLGRLG